MQRKEKKRKSLQNLLLIKTVYTHFNKFYSSDVFKACLLMNGSGMPNTNKKITTLEMHTDYLSLLELMALVHYLSQSSP
jgi:hypothetical protein